MADLLIQDSSFDPLCPRGPCTLFSLDTPGMAMSRFFVHSHFGGPHRDATGDWRPSWHPAAGTGLSNRRLTFLTGMICYPDG
jgi:hypothetical protein